MKLPENITLIEVLFRDGLQNEARQIPTKVKIESLFKIIEAGLKEIEIGSFVSPRLVPQMADTKELAKEIQNISGVKFSALIPNLRGYQEGRQLGMKRLNFVFSASEKHNQSNVNKATRESVAELAKIAEQAEGDKIKLRVGIATSFGCPMEGNIPAARVLGLIEEVLNCPAVEEIGLADTAGMGNPPQVFNLFSAAREIIPRNILLTAHLHNSLGTGMANIFAALQAGVTRLDTSIGGLGGCPFIPGAAGNIATEDLANVLAGCGVDTGINIDKILALNDELEKWLGHPVGGYVHKYLQKITYK